ncbi:MerR family transcriptional regulator [Paenibacillus hunanensis]|uniref:MerR family transcriptional regulator n=1 Tax=Paenibacillus hunanensis TaxID=539262 RepID=UPI0020268FF0|nr:MerR family transcriptional regulator [Paenibacillus hunanensis]MCL9662480.1 MerR family transcriptional regulator [Paenibacillus hunanensis]
MGMETTFTIKQVAEQTGISEDTIRYYEKIALLPKIARKENGHRMYRSSDMQTILLLNCLKKTGMSLDEMRPFLDVSADADPAEYPELVQLLRDHRANIVNQIASLQQIVDFVDMKLEEGKYRRDFSQEQSDDCTGAITAAEKEKLVSTVQMNYFPVSNRGIEIE